MSSEGKIVQTQLPPEEYERLRRVADQEDKSLKEVVREAVRDYTDTHTVPDPDDPFFANEPPAGTGERVSAADADDILYGRSEE